MKSYTYVSALILAMGVGADVNAEELNATNIVGVYESEVVVPTPLDLGLEVLIGRYDLKADGTLAYTEFYNRARTVGILGTDELPPCKGSFRIEFNFIKIENDCSRYNQVYQQKIDLTQATIEELMSPAGKLVKVSTSLFPDTDTIVLLRKLR